MEEEWRPVVNLENFYQVSNKGRVKSLDRELVSVSGNRYIRKGKIMKANKTDSGYEQLSLWVNKKRYNLYVHRLVAIAFLKNEKELPEVNHKDGDKLNNNVENLEWVTSSDNMIHSHSLFPRKKLLTKEEVIYIKSNFPAKGNYKLAKELGRNVRTVSAITSGLNWKHI